MSHIVIYLKDSFENLDIKHIYECIDAVTDWYTLGELVGIEEDEVDNFMDNLQWNNDTLEIGLEGKRPIQIHFHNKPEEIKENLDEVFEENVPTSIIKQLEFTKTVVYIELGLAQIETMYEVVAFEVAFWLAENKHGLVYSLDNSWYDYKGNIIP